MTHIIENFETIHSAVKQLAALDFDTGERREILEELPSDDFEVGNYRFIHTDEIDQIMQDELTGDEYVLGCCNAWFIADCLDIPLDAVEKMQKAEAFEGLGALMAQKIELVQEQMVRHDGYGHHFNSYDGGEEEIEIDGTLYHVFRTN